MSIGLARWCAAVLPLIALACSESTVKSTVEPRTIEFPPTYMGSLSSLPFNIRLDGKLLQPVLIDGKVRPNDVLSQGLAFDLKQNSPLGGGDVLTFEPLFPDAHSATLVVTDGDTRYRIELKGVGLAIPVCDQPDDCWEGEFDRVSEQCVRRQVPDGTRCGPPSCETESFCQQGQCLTRPLDDDLEYCAPPAEYDSLQPVWTYQSKHEAGELAFSGTTDDSGHLYLLDCSKDLTELRHCDLVSLDASGHQRWRRADVWKTYDNSFGIPPQLMVADDLLIVSGRRSIDGVGAFRLSDGSSVWMASIETKGGVARTSETSLGIVGIVGIIGNLKPALLTIGLDHGDRREEDQAKLGDPRAVSSIGELISLGDERVFGNLQAPVPEVPARTGSQQTATRTVVFAADRDGHRWSHVSPDPAGGTLRAVNDEVLIIDEGVVLDPSDGAARFSIQKTSRIYDAVIPRGDEVLALTDTGSPGCSAVMLQGIQLPLGQTHWRCRVEIRSDALMQLTRFHATAEGGVIFATAAASGGSVLQQFDSAGKRTLAARIPLEPRALGSGDALSAPAVVGSRWVVLGSTAPGGDQVLAAYEVPGLASATSGWIGAGGNARREGTPAK